MYLDITMKIKNAVIMDFSCSSFSTGKNDKDFEKYLTEQKLSGGR